MDSVSQAKAELRSEAAARRDALPADKPPLVRDHKYKIMGWISWWPVKVQVCGYSKTW